MCYVVCVYKDVIKVNVSVYIWCGRVLETLYTNAIRHYLSLHIPAEANHVHPPKVQIPAVRETIQQKRHYLNLFLECNSSV